MSIKIEVASSYIKDVRGKDGTEYKIPTVEAYAHLSDQKYPVRMEWGVPRNEATPKPGVYLLGPKSFYVDNFGQLHVRRAPHLMPLNPADVKA